MTLLVLAKQWSRTVMSEHPLQKADGHLHPSINPPMGTLMLKALIWTLIRQGRMQEHWDWGDHKSKAWRATEDETKCIYYAMKDEDEDVKWWCHGGPVHRVPGEIKRSRDLRGGTWSWTLNYAQKRSWVGRWHWAEQVGRLLLRVVQVVHQQWCNGHCLSDSVQHSSWKSNCSVHKSLGNGEGTPP